MKPIICLFLSALLFSCSKNPSPGTFTPNFYFFNGGTSAFDNNIVLFSSSDTVTYKIIISSTYLLSKDAGVTLEAADEYRTSYNANYGTDYQQMPAGSYSFPDLITATTTSIFDTVSVVIYKTALSENVSYMLPIRITSADGNTIDQSSSVIYLHTINGALAGVYNSTGTKISYNGNASDSNIASTDTFSIPKNLIPKGVNSSLLDYADLGPNGWQYILGFSTEDSTFFVLPNDVILNSIQDSSFKILTSSYDKDTKNIYIKSSYKNLSGNERIVEETLTLQ